MTEYNLYSAKSPFYMDYLRLYRVGIYNMEGYRLYCMEITGFFIQQVKVYTFRLVQVLKILKLPINLKKDK